MVKSIDSTKIFLAMMAFLVVTATISYIFQIQAIMKNSFQEKTYQQKVNALTKTVQNLDSQYQSLTSLDALTPKIQALGLVKIDKLSYLNLQTNQMAIR